MRAVISVTILVGLISGCSSQPQTPQDQAATQIAVGMLLIASGTHHDPEAGLLWQVRIPPDALTVINSIEAFHASSGRWPTREEVKLPSSITEISLDATDDLTVVMKNGSAVVTRCGILKDGTIVVAPMMDDLVSALQQAQARSGVPAAPVTIPAIK